MIRDLIISVAVFAALVATLGHVQHRTPHFAVYAVPPK